MADVTDVPGPPVDVDDEFVLHRARRATSGSRAADLARRAPRTRWEVVTAMSRRLPRVYHAAAGPVGLRTLTERRGSVGAHRALERRHLRPRGRRDRERRPTSRCGCRPASAARIKRAGGDAIEFAAVRQAPVPLGERDRDAGRHARRPGRHPRRLARSRPAHERPGHRGGRPQRDGPGPRDRRDEHRVPGARHRRRRLPARRGRPDHGRDRPRRAGRAARRSSTSSSRCAAPPPTRRSSAALARAAPAIARPADRHEHSRTSRPRSSATSSSSRSPARSSCAA